MCSLLTPIEALDASDAFFMSVYGRDLFTKWKDLKYHMNFINEQAFVKWLLELGEKQQLTGTAVEQEIVECSKYLYGDVISDCKRTSKESKKDAECLDEEKVFDHDVAEFCEVNSGFSVTSPSPTSPTTALASTELVDISQSDENNGEHFNGDSNNSQPNFKLSLMKKIHKSDAMFENGSVGGSYPNDVDSVDGAAGMLESDGDDSTDCVLGLGDGDGTGNESGDDLNMSSYYTVLHDDDRRGKKIYTCSMCFSYTSYRKSNMMSHIREVHLKIKRLACTFCDYQCSRRGHLKDHLILKHGYVSKYTCDSCHRPFANRAKLVRHGKTCGHGAKLPVSNSVNKKSAGRAKTRRKRS